ncbi:MAG: tyrosine-type recombinase/integrase [Candidatus Thiodiazotropha sp. (ex Epidulcina cf. delphinae)]|nr:tyrosine-type recombinase/integrase [Candidatus Thiodiazotropha sp. (ex Epidulcina cf. delphinae)]
MQIHEVLEQFLSHCRHSKKLSDHTLRAYTIDLEQFKEFAKKNQDITTCDRNLIRGFLQHLFEVRGLKESSVKRRMACLKAMFGWLEDEMVIERTPFYRLSLKIKLPKKLPRAVPRTELNILLTTPLRSLGFKSRKAYGTNNFLKAGNTRQGFIQLTTLLSLEILFATGARVGELTQIKLSDIDLSEGVIKIKGKGNRERQVYLPDEYSCTLVRAYSDVRTKYSPETDKLLINTRGGSASTQLIRLYIRMASERANMELRVTPHMLRHSTATHLLVAGLDIRFVQRLLGHQSITTTEIYTHVGNTELKSAVCKNHPIGEIMEG